MPRHPFGVVSTADGLWWFVSLPGRPTGRIALISDRAKAPRLIRTIPVPTSDPSGLTLTHDGRYLLTAARSGAVVISVDRAERGQAGSVLGSLSTAGAGASGPGPAEGAFEVATSNDDHFAFVSLEYAGKVAVYDLHSAITDGFKDSTLVGTIKLGVAPVGIAVSPDGRSLYATSEASSGALGGAPSVGTLSLIDVRTAETAPSRSVLASTNAGCAPVRTAVSSDGRVVWVAARASDELLAFSTAKLRTDPRRARLAAVRVGESPLGLALVAHGTRIIVADSDFSNTRGARPGLALVDTAAALAGKAALLGVIRSGAFPREMGVGPGGKTLMVTNFSSDQLETVDLTQAP